VLFSSAYRFAAAHDEMPLENITSPEQGRDDGKMMGREQDAAWNPCPAGSFSEFNVDGGQ
jgi:hypothetical protein